MMNPSQDSPTAAKVRNAVTSEVHETAGRLGNAGDAAKQDIENAKKR
jgi:hypothetical protein